MKADDVLLGVAIAAVVVVGIVFSVYFFLPLPFHFQWLTGYGVSDTATINLTVESSLAINFTTDIINWGSGRVTGGNTNATLNTAAGASNVTNGNWTGNTAGLVVTNIGNSITNLSIKAGKNA